MLFYSVGVTVAVGLWAHSLSVRDVVVSLFPIITRRYWFATVYVALCFVCPFVNVALRSMTKGEFRLLLVTELALFSLPSMIPGIEAFDPEGGNSVTWFVVLYTIGAYLRLYVKNEESLARRICKFAASIVVIFVLSEVVMLITDLATGERQAGGRISGYTSIFTVMACVCYFRVFERLRVDGAFAAVVRKVAPLCFGVYLVHEHPLTREMLWGTIGLVWAADRWWLPLALAAEAVVVFLACAVVEGIRQKLFALIPSSFWQNMDVRFDEIVEAVRSME